MIARGRVISVSQGWAEVEMPPVPIGTIVRAGDALAEVIAVHGSRARVGLRDAANSIQPGTMVAEDPSAARAILGTALLGRAVDAGGVPIDGRGAVRGALSDTRARDAGIMQRRAIERPLWTGVRAIDTLLTIGRGARVGIFGPPGAGKSTLLETIVAGTMADAVVLALIGERGREAREWIERCSPRTTVVCATSDRAPGERVAAARFALAHARRLAFRGLHVLVVIDSLARVAYALRELGGARGEAVGRGGYPPSVFAEIATLVEGAGAFERGSVSLVATVLHDGDEQDPVSESVRSLLDGHIVLSSALARAGRFPAIDVLASASRTMRDVSTAAHRDAALAIRRKLAALSETAEARAVGIEPPDPDEPAVERLLRQPAGPENADASLAMLTEIADTLGELHEHYL